MENILHVWNNRNSILEGIKNNLFKKEHIELVAQDRMKKCSSCPHLNNTGEKCLVPGTQPCCGLCGCKLSWKLRSLSEECPDPENKRWEKFLDEHEEYDFLEKNKPE